MRSAVVGVVNSTSCGQLSPLGLGLRAGVYGEGDDPNSAGVSGFSSQSTGVGGSFGSPGTAIMAEAYNSGGTGVFGFTTGGYALHGVDVGATHGYGVLGEASGTAGVAVRGNANASTGVTYGVYGYSASQDPRSAGLAGQGITGGAFFGTATGAYATCSGWSCNGLYATCSGTSCTAAQVAGLLGVSNGIALSGGNFNVSGSSSIYYGSACVAGSCAASDQRLKKNIEPLAGAMDKLLQIKGVTYEWKTPDEHHPAGKQTGVIAQDVEKVFPEWVTERPDGVKVVNIDQREVLGLTVEALRTVENENKLLRDRVAALESGRQPRISGLNLNGMGLGVGGLALAGAVVASRRKREEQSSK
jgi:hypothetical protein